MNIRIFSLCILGLLQGCNSVNPVWDTFKTATGISDRRGENLTPGIEYLQVKVNGHQVMMALGYRTFPRSNKGVASGISQPELNTQIYSKDQFTHEYWYSSQKEMLELVDGRIYSAMGMTTEWRKSNNPPPNWDSILRDQVTFWTRSRDLMPGYRYGFTDEIQTRLISAPTHLKDASLDTLNNATWFEDSINSKDKQNLAWSYKQLFARVSGKIVYSEQCIASDLCLSLKYIGMISKDKS